jgi:hypothetical protein
VFELTYADWYLKVLNNDPASRWVSFSVLGDLVVSLELDSKRQMFLENYELIRNENETLEMLESGENTVYVFDEARCDDVADIEGGYSHPARVDGVRCAAGRRCR